MIGIVLAGGLGTRLRPVTKVVNKHLLDVYDEPMVFYPIRTLARAGITDVVIVTGELARPSYHRTRDPAGDATCSLTPHASGERGPLPDLRAVHRLRQGSAPGSEISTDVLGADPSRDGEP